MEIRDTHGHIFAQLHRKRMPRCLPFYLVPVPSAPPVPALIPVGFEGTDVVVELDLWLPMEVGRFETGTMSSLRRAIADAADVHAEKVRIAGFLRSCRRLP